MDAAAVGQTSAVDPPSKVSIMPSRRKYHAEHVGSLLRPPYLLDARQAYERGELTIAALRIAEDRAIEENLRIQADTGIGVFTDGEARRESWRAGLFESVGGVVPAPRTMTWYRDGAELPPEETLHDGVAAAAKVARKGHLTGTEAAFMAARAAGPFKLTMISASLGGMIWHPEISAPVYPTPAALIEDLIPLQLAEVDDLVASYGVRWIQLDSLAYNRVIDSRRDDRIRGVQTPGELLDATIDVDSRLVGAIKREHPDLTIAMHICRGNYRSSWAASGSYEAVAERLFNEVPVDRFLLEYDTERAGDFKPLRFVPGGPDGPVVVLGLVTTKLRDLEDPDALARRIDEAAAYVPLDNLAISPQCGFASGSLGNLLSADDQRRKLDLVVSTAQRVWG
jgi:5-methyltetrahydropteroyltriglutamate--homocysteine methyltransferase